MNRFFVDQKIDNKYFELSKENLDHLKVLRIGDKPFICVYQSKFFVCKQEGTRAYILEEFEENHEHSFQVVLYMPLIKLERFEWALQKATELGVTKIVPVQTNFTDGVLVKKVKSKWDKFSQRWNQILKNAAEQSFRNIIPTLNEIEKFSKALFDKEFINIIAHEKQKLTNESIFNSEKNVALFVGPEGGFSESEITLALENGAECVSLGNRILRAETAAIALLAKLI